MTLQVLQYYVALGKYRNFTKAAQECFISQPALSRAIRSLEEEMECRLIERTSPQVEFTPQGEICLNEAQLLLRSADEMKERVKNSREAKKRTLRLGYIIYHQMENLLEISGGLFEQLNLEPIPYYAAPNAIIDKVLSGEIDAAVMDDVYVSGTREAEILPISKGTLHAIVPVRHPLATEKNITIDRLTGEPLVMWDPVELKPVFEATYNACTDAGLTPRLKETAKKLGDMITQVTASGAVGLSWWYCHPLQTKLFRSVPIEGTEGRVNLAVIRRKDCHNPTVLRYFSALSEKQ